MMADPRIKDIKVKTGIVKRVCKERVSYQKEAEQLQEKIKRMQEEGKELYYIKKQDELLQETLNVIPGCQKAINKAYADLKSIVESEKDLEEVEEYQTARTILQEFESYVTSS